jgi:hypothetical protein
MNNWLVRLNLSCLTAIILSGCRIPDMVSLNPYYGDTAMEHSNTLDHHEWGLGLSFTWDLNPERYSNPMAIPDPGRFFMLPDGTYWPMQAFTPEKSPDKEEDTERVKETLKALGLEDQIKGE